MNVYDKNTYLFKISSCFLGGKIFGFRLKHIENNLFPLLPNFQILSHSIVFDIDLIEKNERFFISYNVYISEIYGSMGN